MYYKTYYDSPVGKLIFSSDGKNLVGVQIEDQKYCSGIISTETVCRENLDIFIETKNWLDKYFSGKNPKITELFLSPYGTDFRKEVWNELCNIPYGEVVTYGYIAKKIAIRMGVSKMSSRAIGGAVGHNPILIIIPCHRVIGSNGKLIGYSGGLDIKFRLLQHEGVKF